MYYADMYYETTSVNLLELVNLLGLGLGLFVIIGVLMFAYIIFLAVCNWKLNTKAGKPGWASLIPIYNTVVLLQIAELPEWYVLLLLIPFVNIYIVFKLYIEIAKHFGKGVGFGILTVLFAPICIPILALGKSQYRSKNGNMENQTFNNQMQNYNAPEQNTYNPTYITPVQGPVTNTYVKSFCPNCGNKVERGSSFCAMCGEKL